MYFWKFVESVGGPEKGYWCCQHNNNLQIYYRAFIKHINDQKHFRVCFAGITNPG